MDVVMGEQSSGDDEKSDGGQRPALVERRKEQADDRGDTHEPDSHSLEKRPQAIGPLAQQEYRAISMGSAEAPAVA